MAGQFWNWGLSTSNQEHSPYASHAVLPENFRCKASKTTPITLEKRQISLETFQSSDQRS